MIRYACNRPKFNAEAIVNEGFPTLGFSRAVTPMDGFGMSIEAEMSVIPARELPPPRLTYQVGNPKVWNGSWNILDVKFHQGASVASWWVVVIRDGMNTGSRPTDQKLEGLVTRFTEKCKRSGMSMPMPLPRLPITLPSLDSDTRTRTNAIERIRGTFKEKLAETVQKPSFVLVLLEKQDKHIYPAIKVRLSRTI